MSHITNDTLRKLTGISKIDNKLKAFKIQEFLEISTSEEKLLGMIAEYQICVDHLSNNYRKKLDDNTMLIYCRDQVEYYTMLYLHLKGNSRKEQVCD